MSASEKSIALRLFAVYFALHAVLRWLLSDSLQADEGELFLMAQSWEWGYGSQPPLYVWVQKLIFLFTGPQLWAVTLFKNSLLFAAYAGVWAVARRLGASVRQADIGLFAVLFAPMIMWSSQRDQTHQVLACALTAWTLVVWLRLIDRQRTQDYLWLGLVTGLGALSKYNYLIVFAAMLVLPLIDRSARRVVVDRRAGLSLLCALSILAPHLLWALNNRSTALDQAKAFDDHIYHSLSGYLSAVSGVGVALLVYVGVPTLLLTLCCGRPRWPIAEQARSLLRLFFCGVVLTLVALAFTDVTQVRPRWMQPLMLTAYPLAAVCWWPERRSRLVSVGVVHMLIAYIGLYGSVALAAHLPKASHLNIPYREMVQEFLKQEEAPKVLLVAGKRFGGSLRLALPETDVVTPKEVFRAAPADAGVWAAWEAGVDPEKLRPFMEAQGYEPDGDAVTVSAPYKYLRDRHAAMSFVRLRPRSQKALAESRRPQEGSG